eukprot:4101556-Prymnesium_polylepis.1
MCTVHVSTRIGRRPVRTSIGDEKIAPAGGRTAASRGRVGLRSFPVLVCDVTRPGGGALTRFLGTVGAIGACYDPLFKFPVALYQ